MKEFSGIGKTQEKLENGGRTLETAHQTILLKDGWLLKRWDPDKKLEINSISREFLQEGEGQNQLLEIPSMPTQVHEILISHRLIENPNLHGDGTPCLWVGESDWLYVKEFAYTPQGERQTLCFEGLDPKADIYLNGELIAQSEDGYLPLSVEVTGKLKQKNQLVLHFYSPKRFLDSAPLTEREKARIAVGARNRAFGSTYHDYLGPKPYLMRVGVYGDISLSITGQAAIKNLHADYDFGANLEKARVQAEVSWQGNPRGCSLTFQLLGPQGEELLERTISGFSAEEEKAVCEFQVCPVQLWYPRTHGKQPLYTLHAFLYGEDGRTLDAASLRIGFRELRKIGDFDFLINGLPLKLWGSNLAPLDTVTNVYNPEKMNCLLDLVELSNQNCLRVWGENERLHDDFYNQCDERGIFLWQDFFTTYSMYPADDHMYTLMAKEAEYQVTRLRDHACILLWCGGNESLMMRDYEFPGEEFTGLEILGEIFPRICKKLDPKRYYHRSSPDMGRFANDPQEGDTHGYTHIWYVPGNYYPVFLSENCRVSTPALRTMKRMMAPEDLWPEGYDGLQHKNSEYPWPETWNRYNSNLGFIKLGDIETYYDATDLDSMLYRIGWGHGEYIRSRVERYRRGRPAECADTEKRITKGHLLWKLNNSCNHIFFGVLDYFLEPYIPFYALKRAYAPVLLSFEVENFIRLWMVNDTVNPLSGRVYVRLWNPFENRVEKQMEVPFSVNRDQSAVLCDLNEFGQFKKNLILHAYAVADDGRRLAETFGYTDIERRLRFPEDGKISMTLEGDTLVLSCSRYLRCVELLGKNGGEEFGWIFEDNYFDMIPGQIKRVKVYTRHSEGTISAKGYYSKFQTEISYKDFPVSQTMVWTMQKALLEGAWNLE